MAEILYGAPVAAAISKDLAVRIAELKKNGIVPTLAIVRIGDDPDDIYYENSASRFCAKVGAEVRHISYPADCTESRLVRRIKRISGDNSIHGCLILRPLPKPINEHAVFEALSPEKDIDCLTDASLGSVFAGNGVGFPPCTAEACIGLLEYYGIALESKSAVVIGRSLVVGRPVSMMLQQKNATVVMCHSKTFGLEEICRGADIIVSATGCRGLVGKSFVRRGQTVIDVGTVYGDDGKLYGDVVFDEVSPLAAAITPVPGGVGSVTTAMLVKHLVEAAEKAMHR